MSFATDIEAVAGTHEIQGVVVGGFGGFNYELDEKAYAWDRTKKVPVPVELKNKQLSWATIRPYLDYEYDGGYGTAECHAIYAWTATRIIFVREYDGSTSVEWLPRYPTDCKPEFK